MHKNVKKNDKISVMLTLIYLVYLLPPLKISTIFNISEVARSLQHILWFIKIYFEVLVCPFLPFGVIVSMGEMLANKVGRYTLAILVLPSQFVSTDPNQSVQV